jgi:hypothetical protein
MMAVIPFTDLSLLPSSAFMDWCLWPVNSETLNDTDSRHDSLDGWSGGRSVAGSTEENANRK